MAYQKQIKEEIAADPGYLSDALTKINYIRDLGKQGRPKNAQEAEARINDYFDFCRKVEMMPSIEGLSLALDISRKTFWAWCNGSRGAEFEEVATRAKQVLNTFIETSMYKGKINPAAAIFSLKNVAGWTDTQKIETSIRAEETLRAALLPIWDENSANFNNLPIAQELNNLRSDIPTFESEVKNE